MTAAQKKKGDLGMRVLTALVAVPVLLVVIFWKRHEGWFAVVAAATAVGAVEIVDMFGHPDKDRLDRFVGVLVAVGVMSSLYWLRDASWLPLVLAAGLALSMGSVMLRPDPIEKAGRRVSGLVLAMVYVGVLFFFVARLKRQPDGARWIILLLSVVWAGDTGAYFAGRAFGCHKLHPKVSPKKTWEGALGGLLASLVAGALAAGWYLPAFPWIGLLVAVLPAAVLGQAGDLCESVLKRACGVKDSGRILPGHGGILDRVDALIFAAPILVAYAAYLAR